MLQEKKAIAITLLLPLMLSISLGEALQPEIEYKMPPIISVYSPVNNDTFSTNNVPISFTVTKPDNWLIHGGYAAQQILKSVNYQLDGKFSDLILVNSTLESPFDYSLNLTNLTDGIHSLKVYAYASGWVLQMNGFYEYEVPINSSSEMVYFSVIEESFQSPSVPEFPFLLALPILLSVLAVALTFRIRKLGNFRNQ